MTNQDHPVALVTGAAVRIGAEISQGLHSNGYNVIVHYRNSADTAQNLVDKLNQQRADSAVALGANLIDQAAVKKLANDATKPWGRINLLVNNASSFYATPFEQITEENWDDLIDSNLKGPFFLAKALSGELKLSKGAIINIVDIYSQKPLANYAPYSIAKAGVAMMTYSLAKELSPDVRVNGVSPGAILEPSDSGMDNLEMEKLLGKVALERMGNPKDIANTVVFLADSAPYITGQIIAVDGGRSLNI